MNKRIEELAEQCTTIYNSTTFPVDKDFDYEKFAELIIQDCCDMVNKCMQHNNPYDCLLVLDIKEHFGFEE